MSRIDLPKLNLSRATAVQLGTMAALGTAAAVSGGTLAPLLMAALGAEGVRQLGDAAVGFAVNVASSIFSDEVKGHIEAADVARRSKQNHDIQRAINLAIAKCVGEAAKTYDKSTRGAAYLQRIAQQLEANPLTLELQPGSGAIDEVAVTALLTGDADAIRSRAPLTTKQWEVLVGQFAHALGEETMQVALEHASANLHGAFSAALVQAFNDLGAKDDPAWFAIVLRFLGEIHAEVKALKSTVEAQSAVLTSFKEAFASHAAATTKAFEELQTLCQRRAAVPGAPHAAHDEASLAVIKTLTQRLSDDLPQMRTVLDRMESILGTPTKDVPTVIAGLQGLHIKIDGLQTATAAPPPASASNFTTLGIAPNANFMGREAELLQLRSALFPSPVTASPDNAAASNRAAALTQGFTGEGGIGKSQLAQRFAERTCKALGGGETIAGVDWNLFDCVWWLDCAKQSHSAAARALAEHLGYTPTPTDNAVEFHRAIRERLDADRRHLLILDNLEAFDDSDGKAATEPEKWAAAKDWALPPGSRLLVTTREQHLPSTLARTVRLDVLSLLDARALLRGERQDLQATGHIAHDAALEQALDDVTAHLGRLALAVDMARAWLTLNPGETLASLLAALKNSDAAALALFDAEELEEQAHRYRLSVASTLALHMDALKGTPAERLLHFAAYTAPDRIPASLLTAAAGLDETAAREAFRLLVAKSIIHHQPGPDGGLISLHRLTQMVARARLVKAQPKVAIQLLSAWFDAAHELFDLDDNDDVRTKRASAIAHIVAIIDRAFSDTQASETH